MMLYQFLFLNQLIFFLVLRDIEERGRDLESVLFQYNRFVKKSFDDYVRPV